MPRYNPLKDEKLIAAMKLQATPIDFEKLESGGVLQKKGAWYEVKNMKLLPEHVGMQISEIKDDSKGNKLVKLPKSWGKAQLLYKKFTGKDYSE